MAGTGGSLRWESLCKVFERIQPMKRAEKKTKLNQMFEEHRKISGGDMYSLMRLLLPQLHRDSDKRTFRTGLKEAGLAQRITEALALNKNSKDAQRLKNWKQPTAGKGQGNFANVLEDVLKDRSVKKGSLTAKDVVNFLDDLHVASVSSQDGDGVSKSAQKQTKLFESILHRATALEMKWIAREILQDMSAGLSETLVLEVYHPDANELYKTNSNLQEVTEKLKDPNFRMSRINLELFTPCKSMLAEKLMDPRDVTKHFKAGSFWMEPKYDGERLQIHKQGDSIRCFSRAGMEWTCLYQPLFDQIREKRMIKADTCILDGELCGWHREKEQWNNFYSLKDGDMENSQLVFIAFDLLMLEGNIVVDKPLAERRDMLRALIHQEKYVLEVIEWKVGSTEKDALDNAEHWLTERLEGNIIKDPTSKYKPGSRDGEWMKFKPDYSCGVEFDVVLIGASYGSNKRGGKLWQFVTGIADTAPPGEHPKRFRSFCRVGTGMKEVQFTEVSRILKPHIRTCNPSQPQSAMPSDSRVSVEKKDGHVIASWKPSSAYADDGVEVLFSGSKREELDVIIDPRHSIVVTITADKRLIRSNVWMAARDSKHNDETQKGKLGWTLRFPRIKQVRVMAIPGGSGDKPWHECMTDVQLEEEIVKSEDLSNYQISSVDKPEKVGRKRKQEKAEGSGILKAARFHGGNFSKELNVLEGCEVCVINGLDDKKDLEEKAVRLGAAVVANPIPLTTTHIVAVTRDQKYKNHENLGHDVIGHAWLSECWEQKRSIPLEPKYMMHTSAETKERFHAEYDKYGDCYTKTLHPKDLQVLLQDPPDPRAWADLDSGAEGRLSDEELREVEAALLAAVKRRRAAGEEAQTQTQSLDFGSLGQSLGEFSTQSMDVEGAVVTADGKKGFAWSLFSHVHAVCLPEECEDLRVPGTEVAAACIVAGGGTAVHGAALEGGVGARREEVTHVVVPESMLERLPEASPERRSVLRKLGLREGQAEVVSERWILDCSARGELGAEPAGADDDTARLELEDGPGSD